MHVQETGRFAPADTEEQLGKLVREAQTKDPQDPGITFRVGEILQIKGGRFRVESIGRRFLRLRGLPGEKFSTNLEEG